jgi:iron complex transport system substrate-binding protein
MKRLLIAGLLFTSACRAEAPKPPSRELEDWRGKRVSVPLRAQRIVSLVPSCTELLFVVGAGPQVAGVTTYCTYPEEAKAKPKIGDLSVNYEILASLKPDLVVSSWTLARRSAEAVEAMGIPVFCVDPRDFPDIARALRVVGRLTDHEAEGERAAKELEARVAAVEKRVAGKPRPGVCIELTSTPHVAVPGTTGHDLIVRAGGRNLFEDLTGDRYLAVSWESVLSRDPDVYIVGHRDDPPERRPGFATMKAARAKRCVVLDLEWLNFPTPRLATGLEKLAEILHP